MEGTTLKHPEQYNLQKNLCELLFTTVIVQFVWGYFLPIHLCTPSHNL
jgi:hypothetical protein